MKSSYVIFICPLVLTSVMANQISHTTFESCDSDEWIVTNTTLQWIHDLKIITFNIVYKKPDDHTIYRVQIRINDCKNRTACTGQPIVDVENIDCDNQNLSESEMNICKFANEFANLEKQEEFFKQRYGLSGDFQFVFCMNGDNIQILWNGTDLFNS